MIIELTNLLSCPNKSLIHAIDTYFHIRFGFIIKMKICIYIYLSSLSSFCANTDSKEKVEIHKILAVNEIIIKIYRNLL